MTCYVIGVRNSRSWHTMSYVWPTIFRPWPDRNKFDFSLVNPSRIWKQVQVQVQDSGWAWPSRLGWYPSRSSSSIMAYWTSGRISLEFIFWTSTFKLSCYLGYYWPSRVMAEAGVLCFDMVPPPGAILRDCQGSDSLSASHTSAKWVCIFCIL